MTKTHSETHQRSAIETSNITNNQKEQWLNKILNAYEVILRRRNKKQAKTLLSTYQKLQMLRDGQSLQLEDTIQLKQCLKNKAKKNVVDKRASHDLKPNWQRILL